MPLDNLTGRTFGALTVTRLDYRRNRDVYWWCRCACGRMHSVRAAHLRTGAIDRCFVCAMDTRRAANAARRLERKTA